MKKQQINKSSAENIPKVKNFPQCINKKEARMVCLNQGCEQYAFFCLQCDDQSCEQMHRHENHEDKFVAISFKEFIRRVLKEKKPIQQLEVAVSTYKETLERLKADINEFVEKEMRSLNDIITKASEVQEDLLPLVKKLREEKYPGLQGKEMDYLWRNSGDSPQLQKMQAEMADFIRIKEEELKAISQHFENLNKMGLQKISQFDESKNKKSIDQTGKKSPPITSPPVEASKAGKQQPSKLKK